MTGPDNEHDWFTQRIAAALAGGLSAEEQAKFDAHATECAACAAALSEAKMAEASLMSALAGLRPVEGLEGRIVGRIPSGRRIFGLRGTENPFVHRAAAAVAAALIVGAAGYGGSQWFHRGNGERSRVFVSNNFRQMGTAIPLSPAPMAQPTVGTESHDGVNFKDDREAAQQENRSFAAGVVVNQLAENKADESKIPIVPTGKLLLGNAAVLPSSGIIMNGDNATVVPLTIQPSETTTRNGATETVVDHSALNFGGGGGGGGAGRGGGTIDLNGNNIYTGGTTFSGGTLTFGDDRSQTGTEPAGLGLVGGRAGRGGGGGGGGFGGGRGGARQLRQLDYQAASSSADLEPEAAAAMPPPASGENQRKDEAAKAVNPASTVALADAAPATPAADQVENTPVTQAVADGRKVIRSGRMQFEVESFDAAYQRLNEIVRECHGYIGSTDSQRLPNGKVQGSVSVRVPPEELDVLVLKLRGLGDLKDQQITAQDVTKEYTDLQSELRAAQAMEDRLLEIIRTAKGDVKELVAAEDQVGTWREKVEQVTGQINYYNNLVALSTLQITLTEKNIQQAAVATETETVNAGLEADDVSRARDEVFKAVDAAKGRILQANLREQEAGQFTANLTAAIPPDAAGAVIDRLKQLGRVTRLESSRQENSSNPANSTEPPGLTVQRKDTVLNLSIYNVAAYAARTSENVGLACDDVEAAYHSVLDFVAKSDGGRVVFSSLQRPSPDATVGSITFEMKETSSDATVAFLRSLGTVLQLNVTENPDSANVTTTKRAFNLELRPINQVPAQETDDVTVMPAGSDLRAAYQAILDFAGRPGSKARVVDKDIQEDNGVYTSAGIAMEVSRSTLDQAEAAIAAAGKVVARKANRAADSPNVVDTKVLFRFSFVNVDALQPRETMIQNIAAVDAGAEYQAILDAAREAGAKILAAQLHEQQGQHYTGDLEFDLPAEKLPALTAAIEKAGAVVNSAVDRAPENDASTDAKVRMRLSVQELGQLAARRNYELEVQSAAPAAAAAYVTAALGSSGQVVEQSGSSDGQGRASAKLVVNVPMSQAEAIVAAAGDKGTIRADNTSENPQAPAGPAARAVLTIQFSSETPIVTDENGLAATVKAALTTSARALLWSLGTLLIGLCVCGPFAVIGWMGWRVLRRRKTDRVK